MSVRIRLDLLTEKIEAAFGSVPYPGDNIVIRESARWEYGDINCLCGMNWRVLVNAYDEEKEIMRLPNILDLTDKAFHYYLPGYMLATAKYFSEYNYSDEVICSLLLFSEVSDRAYLNKDNLKRFEMLSTDQKHAVRLFLEYLIQEYSEEMKWDHPDSAQMALEQYWKRF